MNITFSKRASELTYNHWSVPHSLHWTHTHLSTPTFLQCCKGGRGINIPLVLGESFIITQCLTQFHRCLLFFLAEPAVPTTELPGWGRKRHVDGQMLRFLLLSMCSNPPPPHPPFFWPYPPLGVFEEYNEGFFFPQTVNSLPCFVPHVEQCALTNLLFHDVVLAVVNLEGLECPEGLPVLLLTPTVTWHIQECLMWH